MLSILICTYNRGSLIHNTLRSLILDQTLKADEIIVVNGGGRNDCSATLDYWKLQCPYLIEIKTENINLAISRNIGLEHVNGDLVLMTDDDAEAFPDWIEQMVLAHKQFPNAGCIGGEVVDRGGNSLLSRIADAITFPKYQTITEVNNVPGVNCSYKKDVLKKIGKQDVAMFRGEDVDFNWRVIQAGFKVLYIPNIKVYHFHRSTWKGLFHQHYMYGRAYYRVRRKWPNMYTYLPIGKLNAKKIFKLLFLFVLPWQYAFSKSRLILGFLSKILSFFIITSISYFSIYGSIRQCYFDKNNGI